MGARSRTIRDRETARLLEEGFRIAARETQAKQIASNRDSLPPL